MPHARVAQSSNDASRAHRGSTDRHELARPASRQVLARLGGNENRACAASCGARWAILQIRFSCFDEQLPFGVGDELDAFLSLVA